MKTWTTARAIERRPLLTLLLAIGSLACQQAHGQVVVIANPGVRANEISKDDLRDLLTGALSTVKGIGQVSLVLEKPGKLHDEMLVEYVGKSDAAFRAGWRSLIFSGQGVMPKTLDSESAVVEYVAHTAGAIGYVTGSTKHDRVKTLVVR